MSEGLQRVGAVTLMVWVVANAALFFIFSGYSLAGAIGVFLVGVFVGNVLIAFVVYQVEIVLTLALAPEFRSPSLFQDSDVLAKAVAKQKPIRSVCKALNIVVTALIAHQAWSIFLL